MRRFTGIWREMEFNMHEPDSFAPPHPGHTIIAARGGTSIVPVAAAWLIHQVRETPNGCEMRSRSIFNDMRVLPQPAHAVTSTLGTLLTSPVVNGLAGSVINRSKPSKPHEAGPAMLYHCALEMNNLASFPRSCTKSIGLCESVVH
jgi:hypothetical protein